MANPNEPAPAGRVTIQEVADAAKVSTATVSRVLNTPDAVRPELLQRVQEAMRELGYRVNRSARALRSTRSVQRVGFLFSSIQNPFFTDVLGGAERVLLAQQIAIVVGNAQNNLTYEQQYLELMFEEEVSGIIVNFVSSSAKHYYDFAERGVPFVAIDECPAGFVADSVVTNGRDATRKATVHLLEQGHRTFGFLGGPPFYWTAREREAGVVETLRMAGIPDESIFVENGDYLIEGAYAAANRLLERVSFPVAVVTCNNSATIALLQAISERHLRIPQDVALVGFDEMTWTSAFNPALSVINQHPYHIGAVAAELLLSRMRNPERPIQQVMLEPELIIRASSLRPE